MTVWVKQLTCWGYFFEVSAPCVVEICFANISLSDINWLSSSKIFWPVPSVWQNRDRPGSEHVQNFVEHWIYMSDDRCPCSHSRQILSLLWRRRRSLIYSSFWVENTARRVTSAFPYSWPIPISYDIFSSECFSPCNLCCFLWKPMAIRKPERGVVGVSNNLIRYWKDNCNFFVLFLICGWVRVGEFNKPVFTITGDTAYIGVIYQVIWGGDFFI